MLAEFEAIKAHLDGATPGLRTHLFYAYPELGPEELPPLSHVPYVVLEHGYGDGPPEPAVGGDYGDLQFDMRARAVTSVPDAPGKVLARVHQRLAPGFATPVRVPMPGRVLHVAYLGVEVHSAVDRDLTFSATNRHPHFGVCTFQVTSQPS